MKNDLKYIIKKIIIGIGIALGIMFFKPYIAFADTPDYYFNMYSISSSSTYTLSENLTSSNYVTIDNITLYDNYNIELTSTLSSSFNSYYILFYSKKTNRYFLYYFSAMDEFKTKLSNNLSLLYSTSSDAYFLIPNLIALYTDKSYNEILNLQGSLSSNNIEHSTLYSYMSDNKYSKYQFYLNDSGVLSSTKSNENITEDYEVIKTNLNANLYKYKGEQIYSLYQYEEPIIFPPIGYEQINLNGYQGVLVTPKNFNTMLNESSHTEQPIPGTTHTYLDLDYYSQNCVRGVLINIQNVQNILTSDISSGSGLGASAGSINGTCFEEPTKTTLSYQYDMYSGFIPQGILIYNNQKIEPSWDSGFNSDFNPFGESFVWVNTNLYNYYLIPNLSTFNADINYVDYDNTDKNLKIENLPTFEDLIKDTQLNQDSVNDNLNTRAKLESIFSFVKIPFTFLNNLINGTCEPLTARFPHSSTDIVLPCLSSSFAGWLGENAYKFFQLIINGLLVYKICISLIQFTTKNLDPSDARIEVLHL